MIFSHISGPSLAYIKWCGWTHPTCRWHHSMKWGSQTKYKAEKTGHQHSSLLASYPRTWCDQLPVLLPPWTLHHEELYSLPVSQKTKQKNLPFLFLFGPCFCHIFLVTITKKKKSNEDTPCVNEPSWTYVFQPWLGLWMATAEMSWLKRDLSQTAV